MFDLQGLIAATYKPVFVGFIAYLFFLGFLYFVRRKKHFYFYLVLASSLLPLFSLLRTGVHQSGDFAINIVKSVDLWVSLSHGIFPAHWASLLNATYGYPLFLFTYPLPYYSIVFLKFLGFSFISSEKIMISVVFILSGIGMYLLTRTFLKPAQSSLASVLYLFAPYHLVDMHFRVALGELFAYAFLPYVFYFILQLRSKYTPTFHLLLSLSFFGLILSHQAITLVSTPFIFLLPLLLKTRFKTNLYIYSALLISILLSSFYWLPLVTSIQYTHQVDYAKSIGFENPLLYLFSPWRYSFLYQGPIGQISFPMGFAQLSLVVFSLFLLVKKKIKKTEKKLLITLLLVLAFMSIMLLPIAEPLWKLLPFMTNFQFAYRLMLPISFVLALIGGLGASYIYDKRVIGIITLAAILITILNWGTRTVIPDITDSYLIKRTPLATYEGEGLQPASPRWRDSQNIWVEKLPASNIEILTGKAKIVSTKRTPILHAYSIFAEERTLFRENTFYFPGWNLYVNGEKCPFSYQDKEKTNTIRFFLPPGKHQVSLKFENTRVITFANSVSLITFASFLLILTYFSIHKRK
ncbi:MAG: 6-pyruvoyl-tetrahydropterin synthase-related protein [Candidatus Levybacteria bacterium]|nr:6-pyruvoyl-tetrahydropterin synthase-related protein [Candidatus Levybacteria bacterium]